MGWIYLIKCKTNKKCYVGQTRQAKYRQRWSCHRSDAKTGRLDCHLHRAIRKYGWNNFECSVLIEAPNDQLNFWETHFIEKLDTVKYGLNEMPGGTSISPMNIPEIKQKRINKMKEPEVHAKWLSSITAAQRDPAQRKLLSKLCTERCKDPTHMQKREEGRKRHLNSLDEAGRKNVIDRMITPEAKAKRVKSLKATLATAQGKARKSNALKKSWQDPISRARRVAALKKAWEKRRGVVSKQETHCNLRNNTDVVSTESLPNIGDECQLTISRLEKRADAPVQGGQNTAYIGVVDHEELDIPERDPEREGELSGLQETGRLHTQQRHNLRAKRTYEYI